MHAKSPITLAMRGSLSLRLSASRLPHSILSHPQRRQQSTTPAKNRIYPNRVRSEDELQTLILMSASSRTPLLTFWMTTWCSTCKSIQPLLHELLVDDAVGEQEGGVALVEVELDAPDLSGVALRYGINAIPTLLAFDRSEAQVETKVGTLKDLKSREFLTEWIRTEARRHGDGGAGGSVSGLLGGLFGR